MKTPTNDRREVLAAVLDEIENPRWQRPGMQRRRQWADRLRAALAAQECDGCMCPTEHDGDYGSAGHTGPCPPHTCDSAQECERGGAEVAAAREAALKEAGQLVRDHLFGSVDAERVAEFLDSRAARLGAAGALAKHDAEVLRAAADEFDLIWNRSHDNSVHPNSHLLRERADRIEAQP